MKFRSDFVTNSSSSSYVVSFIVHSVDNTDIPMTLSKNQRNKEREENASYPWKHSRNHILKAIMNCKTVGELTDLLVEECEKGLYDRSWQGDWLKDLKEDNPAEYEEYINKIQKRIKEFKRKMSKYTSLDELDTVILEEEFYGWGEDATDNLVDFLDHLDIGTSYRWDEEALKEKVGEETAELLLQAVEHGCGNTNGYINTTIKIADGSIHTDADMDPGEF